MNYEHFLGRETYYHERPWRSYRLKGDFSDSISSLCEFVAWLTVTVFLHAHTGAHGLALFVRVILHACVCPQVPQSVVHPELRTYACRVCVCVYLTACAQLSRVTECYRGGSVCTHTTPLTPGWHCAPVMINHVLQRLALFGREGTNHTPHYPGLVTPKRSGPRTPQPVAVWRERGSEQVCVNEREKMRKR